MTKKMMNSLLAVLMVSWSPLQDKNEDKAYHVTGTVVNESGQPLEGADVAIFSGYVGTIKQEWKINGKYRSLTVKTDAKGRFDLSGTVFPKERSHLHLRTYIQKQDRFGLKVLALPKTGSDVKVALALKPGGNLDGMVREPKGKGLPAMSVFLYEKGKDFLAILPVLTDREGRFSFKGVPEGEWDLYATDHIHFDKGVSKETISFKVSEPVKPVVQLPAKGSVLIKGRVVMELDGEEIPGDALDIFAGSPQMLLVFDSKTVDYSKPFPRIPWETSVSSKSGEISLFLKFNQQPENVHLKGVIIHGLLNDLTSRLRPNPYFAFNIPLEANPYFGFAIPLKEEKIVKINVDGNGTIGTWAIDFKEVAKTVFNMEETKRPEILKELRDEKKRFSEQMVRFENEGKLTRTTRPWVIKFKNMFDDLSEFYKNKK